MKVPKNKNDDTDSSIPSEEIQKIGKNSKSYLSKVHFNENDVVKGNRTKLENSLNRKTKIPILRKNEESTNFHSSLSCIDDGKSISRKTHSAEPKYVKYDFFC